MTDFRHDGDVSGCGWGPDFSTRDDDDDRYLSALHRREKIDQEMAEAEENYKRSLAELKIKNQEDTIQEIQTKIRLLSKKTNIVLEYLKQINNERRRLNEKLERLTK